MKINSTKLCVIILFILSIYIIYNGISNYNKSRVQIAEDTQTITKEVENRYCSEDIIVSNKLIRDWVATREEQCEILKENKCSCDWLFPTPNPMADQELCPVQLYAEYWRDCVNHMNDWYPGKLTADWQSQEIPVVTWSSHDKFKELCELYWLDASLIWSLEEKYNLREWLLLAIVIAETSWWHNWAYVSEWCYNLGNVWNNDRGNRTCFAGKEESIEQIAITLNNRYLWKTLTLGCLSNAGSCQWWDDDWYRYATSNGNRERTITNVMNRIYSEDLWAPIDPARFNVKRFVLQ
jgi:hypothetical protein